MVAGPATTFTEQAVLSIQDGLLAAVPIERELDHVADVAGGTDLEATVDRVHVDALDETAQEAGGLVPLLRLGKGLVQVRDVAAVNFGEVRMKPSCWGRRGRQAAGQAWEEAALAEAQGRISEPEGGVAAVVFLASDESSFISRNALHVDNGWYAKG